MQKSNRKLLNATHIFYRQPLNLYQNDSAKIGVPKKSFLNWIAEGVP